MRLYSRKNKEDLFDIFNIDISVPRIKYGTQPGNAWGNDYPTKVIDIHFNTKFVYRKDITHWYQGHVDWKTTEATNLLKVGEIFSYVMVDKDQKSTFTLKGTYTTIVKYKKIGYLMEDKRMVETTFSKVNNRVLIIQRVEIESGNSAESQATWWRSILINFKKHLESKVI